MKKEKLGQEPAFPMVNSDGVPGLITKPYSDYIEKMYTNGMSKRLFLAGMAMQGLLASPSFTNPRMKPSDVSKMAFGMADELLKQEQEDGEH